MKVIPPLPITDALLISSSIPEPAPGETVWASGATCAVGDLRIRTATHRVYERLVAGAGTTPPESDPINWRDAGPTLRWAMFDLERSSQSVMTAAPLVVEIAPGQRINSIGLVGLYGASVRIEELVSGVPVYDRSINLLLRSTISWSQYYYGQFRVLKGLARFDLPMSAGATIRVTINPTAGFARCGGFIVGMAEDLGTIIDEPVSDSQNFSKVTRDEFGVATLVKRPNVPLLQHRVRADAVRLNRLRELRDDLDAVPALYSGADDRESSHFFDTLLVLGFPRKWSIALRAERVVSDLQLEEI
ncbi:hypothetical protein LNV47_18075 [Paucibacter sp. DJ4R-1]|nr:hypothetical protein [Paucibacter sp. DJ4R-1]